MEIDKVAERLIEQDRKIEVSDEAKCFLVEHGWDEKNGARPLRRAIERYLENSLAEAILSGEINEEEPILVIVKDEQLGFEQSQEVERKFPELQSITSYLILTYCHRSVVSLIFSKTAAQLILDPSKRALLFTLIKLCQLCALSLPPASIGRL